MWTRYSEGHKVFSVTPSTAWRHLTKGPWGFDGDSFQVNQIQHPYQGAVYQGFARSAGLGFWESAAYTFLGSFLWEVAGETTKPSINDQVASGIGGSSWGSRSSGCRAWCSKTAATTPDSGASWARR